MVSGSGQPGTVSSAVPPTPEITSPSSNLPVSDSSALQTASSEDATGQPNARRTSGASASLSFESAATLQSVPKQPATAIDESTGRTAAVQATTSAASPEATAQTGQTNIPSKSLTSESVRKTGVTQATPAELENVSSSVTSASAQETSGPARDAHTTNVVETEPSAYPPEATTGPQKEEEPSGPSPKTSPSEQEASVPSIEPPSGTKNSHSITITDPRRKPLHTDPSCYRDSNVSFGRKDQSGNGDN